MINSSKGFTLVELSIVLVIIGLLVGGILVGQSLIESAKLSKMVRQIQQYDALIYSFQTRFKDLPGDTNKFGGYGNNDGHIGASYTALAGGEFEFYLSGESAEFWTHLSATGYTADGSFQTCAGCAEVVIGQHIPSTPFGNEGGIVVAQIYQLGDVIPYPLNRNIYYLTVPYRDGLRNVMKGAVKGVLTPVQALALDKKLDDGLAGSGNATGDAFTSEVDGGECYDNVNGAYSVDNSELKCNFAVNILSQ